MDICEYLLSYGKAGDFGRFRPIRPLSCQRGDRAVVRSPRGLELGVVLCQAQQGHAQFLPNTTVGQLLRLASVEDEQTAERLSQRSQQIFEHSRRVVAELGLPLEILDVEVLLDARQAVVHYLGWAECDAQPLQQTLGERFALLAILHNLALPPESESEESDPGGCGREDCGGGGCSSGSSGACSTCGVKDLISARKGAGRGHI
jgi:hypothetical protein